MADIISKDYSSEYSADSYKYIDIRYLGLSGEEIFSVCNSKSKDDLSYC